MVQNSAFKDTHNNLSIPMPSLWVTTNSATRHVPVLMQPRIQGLTALSQISLLKTPDVLSSR